MSRFVPALAQHAARALDVVPQEAAINPTNFWLLPRHAWFSCLKTQALLPS